MANVEVRSLRKVFPNGHIALDDVSFSLKQGEFVCVVGRSGAGKSTLMRCMNGSLPITAGTVTVDGVDVGSVSGRDLRRYQRRVGFIYQEFHLVGRLSALQNVLTGRLGYIPAWQAAAGYLGRPHRAAALGALERVSMLHKAPQRCDSLSGGEKQRIAIARALAQEPVLLLADEPVANLDPELAEGVLQDLHATTRELGVTTLVNIHNVAQARKFADRLVGIARGKVVFDGPPAEFRAENLHAVYRFDKDAYSEEDLEPSLLRDIEAALAAGEASDIIERIRALGNDDVAALVARSRAAHGDDE